MRRDKHVKRIPILHSDARGKAQIQVVYIAGSGVRWMYRRARDLAGTDRRFHRDAFHHINHHCESTWNSVEQDILSHDVAAVYVTALACATIGEGVPAYPGVPESLYAVARVLDIFQNRGVRPTTKVVVIIEDQSEEPRQDIKSLLSYYPASVDRVGLSLSATVAFESKMSFDAMGTPVSATTLVVSHSAVGYTASFTQQVSAVGNKTVANVSAQESNVGITEG